MTLTAGAALLVEFLFRTEIDEIFACWLCRLRATVAFITRSLTMMWHFLTEVEIWLCWKQLAHVLLITIMHRDCVCLASIHWAVVLNTVTRSWGHKDKSFLSCSQWLGSQLGRRIFYQLIYKFCNGSLNSKLWMDKRILDSNKC